MHQPGIPNSSRRVPWGIIILILLTAIGVFISSVHIVQLNDVTPVSRALSVDEATYYEYVAPRLERLVVEMDDVSEMVAARSRDMVGLSVSENRIDALSTGIISFGESNGVPERFSSLHQRIVDGAEIASLNFGEARSALITFDFAVMPTLLTQFEEAAEKLHRAQHELMTIVGEEPGIQT